MTNPLLAHVPVVHQLASAADSGFGALGAVLVVGILVVLALVVLLIVAKWKIYRKAGKPGWAVFVPVYNQIALLQMTNLPLWWIVLLFIPVVNLVVLVYMVNRLSHVFGKGTGFTVGLIFLGFIFYPILGFGNAQYSNNYPAPAPASDAVRWTLIGLLAWAVLELFFISLGHQFKSSAEPLQTISENAGYATDGNYVYYNDKPMYGADVYSFKMLGTEYAADDSAVYYADTAVPGADPDTFVDYNDGYGKDSSHVYSYGNVIRGADASTFTELSNDYSKDSHAVYYAGEVLTDADPATFQISDANTTGYDAKDAHHLYYYGEIITAADAKANLSTGGQ